jgi:hypothetical protein
MIDLMANETFVSAILALEVCYQTQRLTNLCFVSNAVDIVVYLHVCDGVL